MCGAEALGRAVVRRTRAPAADARGEDRRRRQEQRWSAVISLPWVENNIEKGEEKTRKYGTLRYEPKQQHPGYSVT